MYPLFFDSEILEAGTRIVLLHTSVPFFAEAAIAATSFPHVYVDLSWPVRTPIMRQVLRHVLTQVSSRKILYGSDAWELADQLGMAASTFRKHFGAALDELRQEGWSEDYCLKTAKRVMHENATELMKLPLST